MTYSPLNEKTVDVAVVNCDIGQWCVTIFVDGEPQRSRRYNRPVEVTEFDAGDFIIWDKKTFGTDARAMDRLTVRAA